MLTVVQNPRNALPVQSEHIRIISEHLGDSALCDLQNRHGIHLCPSEAEGFGHYLVEAMSCRAIVIATDAPPMNEMIANDRGLLVRYAASVQQRLGTNFYVEIASLEQKIEMALDLSALRRRELTDNARCWFLANDRYFRARIVEVMRELVG
jgi:glycosyltransferase involved in cell wall biosynthesis